MVRIATITVAIRTPLALESSFLFKNKKKAPRFKMAPILTNFVKTPFEIAICRESVMECPVPKNIRATRRPRVLAIKPTIIPIIISLVFIEVPSV